MDFPIPSSTQDDLASLIAYAFGLCMACPWNQDNPPDCPLHELRLLPYAHRLAWIKACTREQLLALCQHHCACLRSKETKAPPPATRPDLGPFPDRVGPDAIHETRG